MKATINKIEAVSNARFNIDLMVKDDSGKILFSGPMGFNVISNDANEAVSIIKESIKNRINQEFSENGSVAKNEAEKLIGKEFYI